jgi:hypothetical protein
MSLSFPFDATNQFKQNVYSITLDMSGWDRTTIQVVPKAAPGSAIFIYGSNDANALQGVRDGDAQLATNFTLIQGTNLASGTAGTSITNAASLTKVDINARFLRVQGGGADVYRLFFQHTKTS